VVAGVVERVLLLFFVTSYSGPVQSEQTEATVQPVLPPTVAVVAVAEVELQSWLRPIMYLPRVLRSPSMAGQAAQAEAVLVWQDRLEATAPGITT
jgi:hypothetical protein